ncbi:host specificity factor TipJ family phage tail protein [Pseudomonas fluorescens]|uniref:Tip attachment protein J domain-containing protein n=1 Tax=Pseudomonas fluorescens TaxID=294 RepID=A0A5E7AWC1_PSEFL|nr:host specificity factor TipJ family phage tail protein [Pseudomonas fluorescens]VVN83698.1 hypothetical protein PS704_01299 [Pseudomonas fluorescens]
MIKVFPSKLSMAQPEIYTLDRAMTLGQWFYDQGMPSGCVVDSLPLSVFLDGELVLPGSWMELSVGPESSVEIFREPKGADPFSITLGLVFGAKAVIKAMTPKIPGIKTAMATRNSRASNTRSGNDLSLATAKGNQAKLNAVIPEIAGHRKRFPDYALPPHRYFLDPRSQWIDMLLVVGKGEYLIPESSIKIGDTPVISLGEDATYRIYKPGEYIGDDQASKWWHSAPEVGATSTGTAGIDLTASFDVEEAASAKSYQFAGNTINVPVGSGSFPTGWTSGMIARVVALYSYAVTSGGTGHDIITGPLKQVAPFVGMIIEIAGVNAGTYVVASYTAGAAGANDSMTLNFTTGGPVTGLDIGTGKLMAIGYAGLRFRFLAASTTTLALERLTDLGATDSAWPGFDPLTTTTAHIELDGSNLQGGWRGPFAACPSGEKTSTIKWDVFFPAGLGTIDEETGVLNARGLTVEFQYRDIESAGAWTTFSKRYVQRTLDQVGFTETIELPTAIRPEARMRRIGKKSTSTRAADAVQWYGLRANLTAPSAYRGVTLLSIRIKGGNRIASQSESLVALECTRILPVLKNGVFGDPAPTRAISSWVGHVCRSIGYEDSDIDLQKLQQLEDKWTLRGDTYDQILESSSTIKGCLIEALQAGFSELTTKRGLISAVRDEPRGAAFDHIYNPQVMKEPLSRDFTSSTIDDYDGVDVEYTDSRTWQKETVPCRLPGDVGLRVDKIKLEGVTNRDRAWRIGMRQRRAHLYRRKTYDFSTELDALNSEYLDYVALGDNVPGYGQSSMMEEFAPLSGAYLVRSSQRFDWSAGGVHLVAVRRKDGTASGPYVATRIDDYRFTIPELDFVPDLAGRSEPPVLQFGPEGRWCYPALITDVTPSGTKNCKASAVNYDARVYADDDNFAPS